MLLNTNQGLEDLYSLNIMIQKIYEGNYANGDFLDLRYVKHARTRCYVRQYWKESTISSLVSFQTFNEELGQKDTKFVL